MTSEVERSVREFIVEAFLFGEGGDDLAVGESLLDAGIIDSSGILELVSFVERTFGIEVQDAELVPANFDSIAAIAAFIEQRKRAVA
jgi:acyl carrier protein